MPANVENRITKTFAELSKKGECGLVCYIVAGYPDLKSSEEIIGSLVAGGADVIEVGIPFSDPIADGPTIQEASYSALTAGVTPDKSLKMIGNIRKKFPRLPILVMTYSNILVRAGIENFLKKSKEAGVDGFILPDMPVEEAEDYVATATNLGLSTVFLASPNTSREKLKLIVGESSGFVYLVSVYGTTGARRSFEDYTTNAIKNVKQVAQTSIPVAVGFGISTPVHAKFMMGAGADAVIIGSAIIDKVKRKGRKKKMLRDLQTFASAIKKVCRK